MHTVLQQPVTLYCGHTVSFSHIHLPRFNPPDLAALPPAEVEHAMAEFQNRKLAAWRTVGCPVSTCHMHWRHGSGSGVSSLPMPQEGVAFFPPSSYNHSSERVEAGEDVIGGGQILDVSVEKVLESVMREQVMQVAEDRRKAISSHHVEEPEAITDEDSGSSADDEAEVEAYRDDPEEDTMMVDGTVISGPLQLQPHFARTLSGSSVIRTSSKRRRTKSFHRKSDAIRPPHKRGAYTDVDISGVESALPMGRKQTLGFDKELANIVECDVCTQLLYEPVTTPCQHTFCAKCLARSLDHSTRCPVCRQELPNLTYFQDHAVNKLMLAAILTAFPSEYAERQANIEAEERDARLNTPIFVCTLAFPGMPTILHVFEPRYRLMLRRCVESSDPRFGMVLPARGNGGAISGLLEYGTLLHIKSIQMLPDGRSMVETVGSSRFRLREKGTLDGYTVGRIDVIEDISPEDEAALENASIQQARVAADQRRAAAGPSGTATNSTLSDIVTETAAAAAAPPTPATTSGSRPSLNRNLSVGATSAGLASLLTTSAGSSPEHEPSTQELMEICQSFIEQLRSGSAPWLLQRLNNMYGAMPSSPAEFSYWMALVSGKSRAMLFRDCSETDCILFFSSSSGHAHRRIRES